MCSFILKHGSRVAMDKLLLSRNRLFTPFSYQFKNSGGMTPIHRTLKTSMQPKAVVPSCLPLRSLHSTRFSVLSVLVRSPQHLCILYVPFRKKWDGKGYNKFGHAPVRPALSRVLWVTFLTFATFSCILDWKP